MQSFYIKPSLLPFLGSTLLSFIYHAAAFLLLVDIVNPSEQSSNVVTPSLIWKKVQYVRMMFSLGLIVPQWIDLFLAY